MMNPMNPSVDDARILLGTRADVDALIDREVEQIINATTDQIRARERDGNNRAFQFLPNTWVNTGGLDPNQMRVVIYGKVLDHFGSTPDGFDVTLVEIMYDDGSTQWQLEIQWEPVVSLADFARYETIVQKHTTRRRDRK